MILLASASLMIVFICAGPVFANGSQEPSTAASAAMTTGDTGRQLVGNMYATGLPVLKQKETYKVAVWMDPNSKNTMSEKAAVIEAEKQTNIHIDWEEIPMSGWTEKVNVLIASGSLPDAFMGHVDIMKNVGAWAKLNDAIDKYAPNIRELFTAEPLIKQAVTAPDGNIYTLPTNRYDDASLVLQGLWINTDWLKKLGLSMPKTTAEFENVLKAFKTGDPNGNGKADEIPMGALQQTDSASSLDPMFGPFGVVDTTEHVYLEDGKVLFPGESQGYLQGLRWLHELYSQGLIDQEVFTMTSAQFTAKAQNPSMLYGAIMAWLPDGLDPRYGDQYVALPPLSGPSGNPGVWTAVRQPLAEMSGFSITVDAKNPAALVRYYDNNISSLQNEMLWFEGPPNTGQWKSMPGGKWAETDEFRPKNVSPSEFERTVCPGPSSPALLWSKYSAMRVNEPRVEKKMAANYMYLKTAITPIPKGLENPDQATERALLFTDIDNYMKKFKANAIVQGISDAQWQTHLQTLKQLKVEQYVQLWQNFIDSRK